MMEGPFRRDLTNGTSCSRLRTRPCDVVLRKVAAMPSQAEPMMHFSDGKCAEYVVGEGKKGKKNMLKIWGLAGVVIRVDG